MTPTPEQNAKRFIELSENVSVLSTAETNAVMLARAYLKLETELQQLRLAADGMRDALVFATRLIAARPREWEVIDAALAAYRAAGDGLRPVDDRKPGESAELT